jgi:hypothetical protein
VICDGRRCEEAGEFETTVAIRCAHHSNLDALIGKSGDASCPFSFDRGPPFELETELSKKIYCPRSWFFNAFKLNNPMTRRGICMA